MITVAEALQIVLANVRPLPPETTSLGSLPLGLVLAEDIASDLDMPPFDKAMMDGFALRTADLRDGKAELTIIEEVMAGQTPTKPVAAGQATRIMTGAPTPDGADAVAMVERCELLEARVRINDPGLAPGKNILRKGLEMRQGDVVLRAGVRLRPQEFGLLATVGRPFITVRPAPFVGVLCTGDELVDCAEKPGPGKIRNSNESMLFAQIARARATAVFLGTARDETEHLRSHIRTGLESANVLLLSGGVSAGKLDLVPGVLKELGVQALFHQVKMKPGKPLLFGIKPEANGPPRLIFGLPGNPVSSMVCFELFVRPAIRALMGCEPGPTLVQATLTKDHAYRTDRPTYYPAKLELTPTGWSVTLGPWFGSPDLRGVLATNAFALIPEGDHQYRAGQRLEVLRVEAVD